MKKKKAKKTVDNGFKRFVFFVIFIDIYLIAVITCSYIEQTSSIPLYDISYKSPSFYLENVFSKNLVNTIKNLTTKKEETKTTQTTKTTKTTTKEENPTDLEGKIKKLNNIFKSSSINYSYYYIDLTTGESICRGHF